MTPLVRRTVLWGGAPVLIGLTLTFGRAVDAGSVSFAECVARPADCAAEEVYLGYVTVDSAGGDTVALRTSAGPGAVIGWPGPLPSPGEIVSIVGRFEPPNRLVPAAVKAHPLRRVKEWTGVVGTVAWAIAGALVFLDARRRGRDA